MSPSNLTVETWPVTDAGQGQADNEDYVLIYHPPNREQRIFSGSLYVVTDGVGGGARGQLASRYAAEKIMHAYYTNNEPDLGLRLRLAIEEANLDLYQYARQQPELVKMGASVVAAVIRGEQLHVASVGDSRAYVIREDKIVQVTRDHTLVQQLLDEEAITAEEAREHPRRDVVLRLLGAEETVTVDIFDRRLRADDVLILCTDGLTQVMHPDEIATIAATSSPRNASETLVQKANDRGSKDNITIVTALVRDGAPSLETDIPHTWDGRMPTLGEAQQTLVRRREEAPPEPAAPALLAEEESPVDPLAQTVQARRITPEDLEPVGTSLPPDQPQQPPPQPVPPAEGAPAAETRPAAPPPQPVPAPPYQTPVQPAPPYGPQPPPQQPPPQQPPGYPPQPDQAYGQRGVPRGYTPPPGYMIDPATGLPPTPVEPGWGAPPPGGGYAPRIYQPPGQPVVRPPRRGISLGTFVGVGVLAVLLTVVMVVVLINPLDWTLPFGLGGGGSASTEPGAGEEGEAAEAAAVEQPPTPSPQPPPTAGPTATAEPVPPPGMVLVDGGPFMRGVSDDEIQAFVLLCIDESTESGDPRCRRDWFIDAQPVEEITLSPFFIDVTEVTNLNYAACIAAEVCTPPGNQEFYADPAFAQHPVVYVTWDQAAKYCEWAGKRLPTEAEWEKAARWDEASKTAYVFPWGNTWEAGRANTAAAGLGGTAAVQAFAQDMSPYGVLGMAGNVSEWVQDWYFPSYENLGTLNPVRGGNQPLTTPERSVRGAWYGEDITAYVRVGHRLSAEFDKSGDWLGFRCAMSLNGSTPGETPTSEPTQEVTPTPTATIEGEEATQEGITETPIP